MRNRLLVAGDVMLGENLYHFGRGIRTRFQGRYPTLITDDAARVLFEDVEWICFNMECSIAPQGHGFERIESSLYVCTEDALDVFPSRIRRIANVANNHFAQHGSQHCTRTVAALQKGGSVVVGRTPQPVVVNIGKRRVRMWGASLVPDKRWDGEYFLTTASRLCAELRGVTPKNDEYWIVSLHWGREYHMVPDEEQVRVAHDLAQLGFDVIIGHHPHVVQPIATIGQTVVLFSLGNLLFDQNFSGVTQSGLVAKLNVEGVGAADCYRTVQREYRIVKVIPEPSPELITSRTDAMRSRFMPLRMKCELATHIWEVNRQTLQMLGRRALQKMRGNRD